jgi:hypothetical protein
MTARWKLEAESKLLRGDTPAVLTTGMLHMIATLSGEEGPPAATLQRWLNDLLRANKIRRVIKGIYLNTLGHRDVSPAAAAGWIRSRSVVSLAWVLEQSGVMNNFGDTVTCVIPIEPDWPNPQISDRQTDAAPFRFFAMPAALVDERAGAFNDIRDSRFDYPRTTPEKALLDWIYLGASKRSRMTRPPFDMELDLLDNRRLRRLAKNMGMVEAFELWRVQWQNYQNAADVQSNSGFVEHLDTRISE